MSGFGVNVGPVSEEILYKDPLQDARVQEQFND